MAVLKQAYGSARASTAAPLRQRLDRRRVGGALGVLMAGVLATHPAQAARAPKAPEVQLTGAPLPVRSLTPDEVTPRAPIVHLPAYTHRPFERLRPGEWRVVGPPFGRVDKGVLGRSIDGAAVLIIDWTPQTVRSDGQLEFQLRVRDPAPSPPLPKQVGLAQAVVDGTGPWKLFTIPIEGHTAIMPSEAVISWDDLSTGADMLEPDDCNPGVRGCVRRVLECARRTLTLKAEGFAPFTFDLRARPLKTLFRYMGDHACRGAGVALGRRAVRHQAPHRS